MNAKISDSVLQEADNAGDSTEFTEFMLRMIRDALKELSENRETGIGQSDVVRNVVRNVATNEESMLMSRSSGTTVIKMYKSYSREDYLCIVDESAERIRSILQTRYDELEELREAINDRYPFEDLFLKWAEVDDEKELIGQLLVYLQECAENMKKDVEKNMRAMNEIKGDI